MSLDLPLLQRLVTSPFTRRLFWAEHPVIALPAADRVIRDRGLFPLDDRPVDATLHCTRDDLAAMLDRRPPVGTVSYTLGGLATHRKQATALLALASLGWCGPWPDSAASPEHVHLLRESWFVLGIGPTDGSASLFPAGGPLPHVRVRLTEGAAGTELVTVGLSDAPGRPELATLVPPRGDPRRAFPLLRANALMAAESGVPRTAEPHPRFPDGLPLPHQHTWLMRVDFAGGGKTLPPEPLRGPPSSEDTRALAPPPEAAPRPSAASLPTHVG